MELKNATPLGKGTWHPAGSVDDAALMGAIGGGVLGGAFGGVAGQGGADKGRKNTDQRKAIGQTRHSRLLWRKATLKGRAMMRNAGPLETAPPA